MAGPTRVPNLKEVLGAMIFAGNRPLTVREMRNCLLEVAEEVGDYTSVFGEVKDGDVRAALEELRTELEARRNGFLLAETASGYRLQSDEACGVWLKHLLNMRKTSRLSHPSLETLAIIACRQPISRAEIEGIRGVSVDHVIKALMETQLVRIVGRSELPGRPFLFGTTQTFLDHFGLKNLDSLGDLTGLSLEAQRDAVPKPEAPPVVAAPDAGTGEAAEDALDDADAPATVVTEAAQPAPVDAEDAGGTEGEEDAEPVSPAGDEPGEAPADDEADADDDLDEDDEEDEFDDDDDDDDEDDDDEEQDA